jgi:hypothetical protein
MFKLDSNPSESEMTSAKRFGRQQMLDLIWSAPMRNVAADLGVSDVGLKKAVMKAGLPTPPQGHWNRVFAGRPVAPKPTLSPRGFGAPDDIWIGGNSWSRYVEAKIDDPPPSEPVFDETMEGVRQRAEKAVGRVAAVRDFSAPHPAIRQILDDEAQRAEKVKASPYPSAWDQPRFEGPINLRRLRLLNSIALGVSKSGLRVSLLNKEDATLSVHSDVESLPLMARKLTTKGKNAEADKCLSIVVGVGPHHSSSPVAHGMTLGTRSSR